jgi:hypothetical protein
MKAMAASVQALLRPPGQVGDDVRLPGIRTLLACVVIGGVMYGAVMGSFGGVRGERVWQVVYSAAKMPLLLTVSFALSLPSFFVINSLMGLRNDFGQVLRALVAAQAVLAVVLASLAPYTALWYASSAVYPAATLFNAAMFAVASFTAQIPLRRFYRPLIARNRKHLFMLRAWLVVYAFVGIQMAWVLRPFIGDPARPTRFFREDAWGNAYVVLAQMIWRLLTG